MDRGWTMVRRSALNTLLVERERQELARETKQHVKEQRALSERKKRKPIPVRFLTTRNVLPI
jgi:hypothetical protein